jgi:hypothetical protein
MNKVELISIEIIYLPAESLVGIASAGFYMNQIILKSVPSVILSIELRSKRRIHRMCSVVVSVLRCQDGLILNH